MPRWSILHRDVLHVAWFCRTGWLVLSSRDTCACFWPSSLCPAESHLAGQGVDASLAPSLAAAAAGSLRDQLVTWAEGAMPRLRDCYSGTTWLYNSAFISLTCYLQLGKGRNGGVLTGKWLSWGCWICVVNCDHGTCCMSKFLSVLFYLDQPISCRWRGHRWGQGGCQHAAVVHVTGWNTHLRQTLPVQHLERGGLCPRKSGHLWPIPKVLSLVFLA